jgi:hypothetical protein
MILLYRGTSWVSRLIKWVTWSKDYSHASWITDDKIEYESWQLSGVVRNDLWGIKHTPGTEVDVYDFVIPLTQAEVKVIESFLAAHVGEKYDWNGILAFLPLFRLFKSHSEGKWFCSEYIAEACRLAHRELYEKESYKVSPADIGFCTLLKKVDTWTVPERPNLKNVLKEA